MELLGSRNLQQESEWHERAKALVKGLINDFIGCTVPLVQSKWTLVQGWAWISALAMLFYPLGRFYLPKAWTRLYATDIPYLCLGRAALLSFAAALFLTCAGYVAAAFDVRWKRKPREFRDAVKRVRLVKRTSLVLSWGWFLMYFIRYEALHQDGPQWLTGQASNDLWLTARRLLYGAAVVASWPTLLNLAFVCLSADRCGILYLLTGYPYTLVRYLHQFAGKQLVFWASLHSLLPPVLWLSVSMSTLWSHLFNLSSRYTGAVVNFSGLVSYIFLLILSMSSADEVRRKHYERFQIFHFSSAGFLLCAQLHDYETFHYAHAGIVLLISDVLYSRFVLQDHVRVYQNKEGRFKLRFLTSPYIVPQAGQSIELKVPAISDQFHPLSVSAMNDDGFEVAVFERGDWTRAILHHTSLMTAEQSGAALIRGPFGQPEVLIGGLQDVLIVAGGSGLAAFSASIYESCSSGKGEQLSILWLVKSQQEYARFDLLLQYASRNGATVTVNIRCSALLKDKVNPASILCPGEQKDEYSTLPNRTTQQVRARDARLSQAKQNFSKGLMTFITFVGSVVGFIAARLVSCRSAGEEGTSCRFMWKTEFCSVCPAVGCCRIWSCWLAFRALPLISSVCAAVAFGAWGGLAIKRRYLDLQGDPFEEGNVLLEDSHIDQEKLGDQSAIRFIHDRSRLGDLLAGSMTHISEVHVCGPRGLSEDVYTIVQGTRRQDIQFVCRTLP